MQKQPVKYNNSGVSIEDAVQKEKEAIHGSEITHHAVFGNYA